MSGATDLTRWNRAGLRRFRYVNGNAVTYLETLRKELADRFPQWDAIQAFGATSNESSLAQYDAERRDLGWEIVRTFARACHVVTEHIDAFANEAFLGTATQWDSVRRLVGMLDYHPAPPASASTPLVLSAKTGARGVVKAHTLAAKYAPADGSAPVTFETLDDLEVDATLNELRLQGWDRSVASLASAPQGAVWTASEKTKAIVGDLAILIRETDTGEEAAVVAVASIDAVSKAVELRDPPDQSVWRDWERGSTRLLAAPKGILTPRLNGANVVAFEKSHGLVAGDVVAWGVFPNYLFGLVEEADDTAVRILSTNELPHSGSDVFKSIHARRSTGGALGVPLSATVVVVPAGGTFDKINPSEEPDDDKIARYLKPADSVSELYYLLDSAITVGHVVDPPAELVFDGDPGKLAGGDWVVIHDGDTLHAARVQKIAKGDGEFSVAFDSGERFANSIGSVIAPRTNGVSPVPQPPLGAAPIVRLIGPFTETIRPSDYDRKATSVTGNRLSVDTSATGALPDLLRVGKTIALEKEASARDGFEGPLFVKIESVDEDDGDIEIDVDLAEEHGFTYGNLVLRGNVVIAGHGETRPTKILGSGDASRLRQSFPLDIANVAFVADSEFAKGVRASIDLVIDGQTWRQVDTLNDSGPTDADYTARPTEDGFLLLETGDGTRGRRVPTGSSNVVARFRVGTGLVGNIPRGSLALAKPHYLISEVRQLLDATGGADAEQVTSLRDNAPASVLTLERAVSLTDFAALAASQASVWQATAREIRGARRGAREVEVIVVPAGGGSLGELENTLAATLTAHSLPEVEVSVRRFTSRAFHLDVTIRVRSDAFDPAVVADNVRIALSAALSLEHRKLSQDLYLSEIIEIVESIAGVENSSSILDADPMLRRLSMDEGSVAHIDAEGSVLVIRTEEFAL